MLRKKNKIKYADGFTLVELMIVIAIIGILAGVIIVNLGSSVDSSKKASAVTTMSSMLPELVTCQDDNGFGITIVVPTSSTFICCRNAAIALTSCDTLNTDNTAGHTSKWKDINTKTGYTYGVPTGTLNGGDYVFTATKNVNGSTSTITCSYADNECIESTI